MAVRPVLRRRLGGGWPVSRRTSRPGLLVRSPCGRWMLAMAGAVFAAAQLARIYHRVPGEAIMLAWGEVGVIVALCLVPRRLAAGGRGRGRADRPWARLRGADAVRRARVIYTIVGDHPRWGGGGHGGRSDGRPGLAAAGHPDGPGTARPDLPRRRRPTTVTTSGLSAAWAAATTRSRLRARVAVGGPGQARHPAAHPAARHRRRGRGRGRPGSARRGPAVPAGWST